MNFIYKIIYLWMHMLLDLIVYDMYLLFTSCWNFRWVEPLTSRVPMMVIEGNHEIEPQVSGITFNSYLTRFAVPSAESGSKSNLYYSFNAGGVHFIMLGAYVDYNSTGNWYCHFYKYIDQNHPVCYFLDCLVWLEFFN